MANDNIRVLEAGMKKARAMAAKMLAEKAKASALAVCHEAEGQRGWLGFTGNAQTSYGMSVQIKDSFFAWGADQDNPPVIRDKVEAHENVYLEEPYEGQPRRVSGTEDIEFPTSTDALNYILDLPMAAGSLVTARLAFPVEYQEWLRNVSNRSPLELMHQLTPLAFKGMK